MSGGDRTMVCRRCTRTISRNVDSCPHCGASIRSRRGPIALVLIGIVIVGGSLLDIGTLWFFGLIGLFLLAGGVYLLYDRRRRIRAADTSAQ